MPQIANDGMDLLYRSGEGTERFDGSLITPGTFEFLGMPPLLGRVAQRTLRVRMARSSSTPAIPITFPS